MNSKKYNIAIIANAVGDEGKNTALENLIDLLKPLSNEIFIIGDFPGSIEKNIHTIRIKVDMKRGPMLIKFIKFILTELRFSFNLIKISKKIDIVNFFGSDKVLSMLSAKIMRKRTIVSMGGRGSKSIEFVYNRSLFGTRGFFFPRILETLEMISLSLSDRIFVESESAVSFLNLSKYKKKISANSAGAMYMDINLLKITKDLKDKRDLIGFISRLNEAKGIMNFVKAIPLILKERRDLEFLIGGEGELFDKIQKELKDSGVYDKVELTGWIPHDELPNYLNELKLILLPSYSEGLPAIVQEGMACGAVVLATPVGSIPDVIKDGETGFILEDNSPECIAKNVIRALEHPNLEEIVKNARNLIEEEYSYEVMVRKCRDSLDELMR